MKGSNEMKGVQGILPLLRTATASPTVTKGPDIDRKGFEEAVVILHHGAVVAQALLDCKVQESDTTTDGDYTDITGAAFSQITGAQTSGIFQGRINLVGRKRYIRVVGTVTTDTKAATYGAVVVLHQAQQKPITPVATEAFSV